MPIQRIHAFLVHAGKGNAPRQIGGNTVPLNGKLFDVLKGVYEGSDVECNIDISFNHHPDGTQQNDCRDLITSYLRNGTLPNGRRVAARLESVTTNRSGLGLLFLITGQEGLDHKIVLSRFRADSAILAEENQNALTVEFLERVFMKNAASYKAAVYQHASLDAGMWMGRAVDKQLKIAFVSDYWIKEFLLSDFRTTSAAGTRRLAIALRDAARKSGDVSVKNEIAAAATLSGQFDGTDISIGDFQDHFGLSNAAREAISHELRNAQAANERFVFDADEFNSHVAYRTVELDNGGMLTAEASDFDEVFHREDIADDTVRFVAEGKVVDEKLGKLIRR